MVTNQAAIPEDYQAEELRCHHAPGAADEGNCAYMRALARLRTWTTRAEEAHRAGTAERMAIADLSRIYAELACALDRCPNLTTRMPTRIGVRAPEMA